jgi:hypothetical protein
MVRDGRQPPLVWHVVFNGVEAQFKHEIRDDNFSPTAAPTATVGVAQRL